MTGIGESLIIIAIFVCVMARELYRLAYDD